jgi:hypothetical protein
MARIFVLSILLTLFIALAAYGQTGKGAGDLIPVEPVYSEAAAANEQLQTNGGAFPQPSPRDQLYVFWFLGKMLSYPVDKIEAYIQSKLNQPKAVPASAPSGANPFDSVNWREIPPAPPVRP